MIDNRERRERQDGKKTQYSAGRVSRKVKDGMFRSLFKEDRDGLLRLYNALNGTDYTDASEMEIVTIENAVYIVMKNDLAFIIADVLSMYEHQSTVSGNMPVRFLIYLTEEYQKFIERARKSLYGSRTISLPMPKCVVFYNGEEEMPDAWELRLSDAFHGEKDEADVELRVQVYNINYGHNRELMKKCPTLEAYAKFTAVGRQYIAEGMERQEAYSQAVEYCIENNILKEFLQKNKSEVVGMLLEEFDAEKYERTIREEGREEGKEQGRIESKIESIMELLEEFGQVPQRIVELINSQDNMEVLSRWLKSAAKAKSITEFEANM